MLGPMTEQLETNSESEQPQNNGIVEFWLSVTPKLFEWLEWVAVLAAITFVQRKQPSIVISGILTTCYICMYMYFLAYFHRLTFPSPPHSRTWRIVGAAVAGGLALSAYFLAWYAADALTGVGA